MTLDDLRNIDVNDFASWPIPVKVFAAGFICLAILFAGWWFFVEDDRVLLTREEGKEQELRQEYLRKKALAINLPAYQQQMADMQESFGVMLRQLPNRTEIPELLVDITQAGLGRGLQFVLFKPENERRADFYAILPISIKIIGDYHSLANFVSDLAGLPRIVSLSDLTIEPIGTQGPGKLSMTATAMTYRYLDEDEVQGAKAEAKQKPRSRR
jgi:type IV pilus assembly protein PilO